MTETENTNSTQEHDLAGVETTELKADRSNTETEDTIESLRERLQAALAEKEENFRGWQRAQADYANFRRRTEQEREELVKGAEMMLLMHLLPVVDDLERALAGLPPELRGVTWVDGVLLIDRN